MNNTNIYVRKIIYTYDYNVNNVISVLKYIFFFLPRILQVSQIKYVLCVTN